MIGPLKVAVILGVSAVLIAMVPTAAATITTIGGVYAQPPACQGAFVTGKPHQGDDADDPMLGSGNIDVLRGGAGKDRILGLGNNDCLSGQVGDDRVIGGSGDDLLKGGAGNDTVKGGAGRDKINCGAGEDVARAADSDKVANNCEVVK